MYHISKDKRSAVSAELIYQGLLSCIKKKSFEHITISDIQKASSVARTTFYRCFDNISDVLYWKCDICFMEVLGNYSPKDFPCEIDLALHYFRYWMKHSDILELLIKINRHDIIYACHMNSAKILYDRFGSIFDPHLSAKNQRYFMYIRTGFTISILTAWLDGGCKETPEKIVEILKEQLQLLTQNPKNL